MDINEDNFMDSGDEDFDERAEFLKENFTLDDFLKDNKTYNILETNFIWKVEKDLYGELEDFYKEEVDYNKSRHSLLFANEKNYKGVGILQGVVHRCLEKEYDLNIFYDNPSYATSMIDNYNNRIKEEKQERRNKIKEKYNEQITANMKFDWNTKKFIR